MLTYHSMGGIIINVRGTPPTNTERMNTMTDNTNPIRTARIQYGLTQQQLSNLTGIPKRTIENWEGGQRKCPDYVAKLVLDLLDRELGQPDYKAMLEDLVDELEWDLKYLKTDEAKTIVTNVITDVRDAMRK